MMRVYYIYAIEQDPQGVRVIYTEDVTEAATFQQKENGDYVEASVASEKFLAKTETEFSGKVWYECNEHREGCRRTGCTAFKGEPSECRKTSDVRAAVNFYMTEDGDYYEML